MIFTKLHLKNWYSFKDCELDLSYPKKIKNNTIPYEFLENFPNIRFKRLVLISEPMQVVRHLLLKFSMLLKTLFLKEQYPIFWKMA